MSTGPHRWQERRRQADARRPRPMVEACEVRPRFPGGGYAVRIRGSDLVTPGIRIEARLGDQHVTDIRVDRDGMITGVVEEHPHAEEVVVAVGPEETRAPVSMVARPAIPELRTLRTIAEPWWRRFHRWTRGRR